MNDAKVYAPFRCVAAFADGSRLLFDGLTREQARSTMDAAMEQHGDIGWWNWVTDENYRNGEYYKLIPRRRISRSPFWTCPTARPMKSAKRPYRTRLNPMERQ